MMRIALFLSVFLLAFAAGAQEFPTRPVTIIVPFSAGGPTDTIARIMAQRMTKALGQNVLVENTTGAGGTIGVGRVARAAPDGYTLGIGHIGTHVVNGAIYEPPYDLQKDFEPVAMIASNPQIIVSKLAVPARDLKELIAWVKANQDKVSLATGGGNFAAPRDRIQAVADPETAGQRKTVRYQDAGHGAGFFSIGPLRSRPAPIGRASGACRKASRSARCVAALGPGTRMSTVFPSRTRAARGLSRAR